MKTTENLKGRKYENCNVMVHIKTSVMEKYAPLQSLKEFTVAPNLMYACLVPFEKLNVLKEWANSHLENCKKYNVSMQLRSAQDRKKILHEILPN